MKKYKIVNSGCDDFNWFYMELNEEELKVVIKLFEENNTIANCCCTPHLNIYDNEDLRLTRDCNELRRIKYEEETYL